MKRKQLCLCLINAEQYYLQENILSYKVKNVDLHMYCTVNVVVVNYFETQIPEIEDSDGQLKIKLNS